MLIYLADLVQLLPFQSNKVTPLGVGFIGSYLKKEMPNINLRIYKDPKKLIDHLYEEPPDVLGLSSYLWNVRLSHAIAKKAKEIKKEMTIVFGGPFFDKNSPGQISKFFSDRPQLDLYITDEGEWSFAYLIKLIEQYGNNINDIPFSEWPRSFYSINPKNNEIKNNQVNETKTINLNDIPSPYLTGLLDSFLEDGQLSPIIETSRGCPYTCAFCTRGSRNTKLESNLFEFSIDRVKSEIHYIKDRSRNYSKTLYIADSNFGILERDLEISKIIKECSDNDGFPVMTYASYAKNVTKRIVEIAKNLRDVTRAIMSKQSLNPETLKLIKRKNISSETYDELRKECEINGIDTVCELIYGLPGETYDSFIKGVISTVKTKQSVTLYNLRLDAGQELATTESREKYAMKTSYRVLPGTKFSYNDIYSAEYEEIVTENKWINKNEILHIRLFYFLFSFISSDIFREFRKGLLFYGFDHATLVEFIINDKKNWPSSLEALLHKFMNAAASERISPHNVKLEFTKEDIEEIGSDEALNPFYVSTLVSDASNIQEFKEYLLSIVNTFAKKLTIDEMLDLKNIMNISFDNIVCYERLEPRKDVEYSFDVEGWLKSKKEFPLQSFLSEKSIKYTLKIKDEILYHLENAKRLGMDTVHAVYYVRMHTLHLYHDRIFCYKRFPTL